MSRGMSLRPFPGWSGRSPPTERVRVLFEFAPAALRDAGTSPDLLLEFFRQRGFELYETEGARLKRLRDSQQLISGLGGRRYTNLLAARDAVETDD
jgi:hypothetical protein